MTAARTGKSLAAWLALAAMALNALWPLIANAKPSIPSLPSEICSASGLKHAPSVPDENPGKGVQASHCTFCPAGAAGLALPGSVGTRFSSGHFVQLLPSFVELRRPAALDLSAPPRAPPALS